MKKFIYAVFLFLTGLTNPSYATVGNVELSYDHSQTVKTGHPHVIPMVTSDDDDVTIKCDSTLYNVDVIIRDQYGNVMHHSTQTIGPDETIIYVPSMDGNSEKTTIDLYYDRKHLSGNFDE